MIDVSPVSSGRPFRRALQAAVLISAVVAPIGIGHAAEPDRDRVAACRADYLRYCADVRPGGGAVRACLETHRETLAPQCRAVLDAAAKTAAPAGPRG